MKLPVWIWMVELKSSRLDWILILLFLSSCGTKGNAALRFFFIWSLSKRPSVGAKKLLLKATTITAGSQMHLYWLVKIELTLYDWIVLLNIQQNWTGTNHFRCQEFWFFQRRRYVENIKGFRFDGWSTFDASTPMIYSDDQAYKSTLCIGLGISVKNILYK